MHWGGWCRPLEPIDFEQRAWVPYSGWPITRATLEPYYPLAQEFCQLGEFSYDPADWDLPKGALLSLPADRWHSRIIQFSPPTRFGIRYRDQIARATTLTVYLHSTALRLTASGNGRRILGLKVATLAGNSFEVTARSYVLAAGGIDNPRLLLASNDVLPAGIGNDDDLVGRFFADHIQLDTAGLFPVDRRMNLDLYQPSSREYRAAFATRWRAQCQPHGLSHARPTSAAVPSRTQLQRQRARDQLVRLLHHAEDHRRRRGTVVLAGVRGIATAPVGEPRRRRRADARLRRSNIQDRDHPGAGSKPREPGTTGERARRARHAPAGARLALERARSPNDRGGGR